MSIKNPSAMLAATAAFALFAAPAVAQAPMTTSNGEWLSLSGTVEAVAGENFVLDYGRNSITVEMDDYDWYNENAIVVGDEVTVTGRMDKDFLQARRLEASSVYVDSLHTRFYANAADEEDWWRTAGAAFVSTSGMGVTGMVQSITGDEMTVDAGVFEYKVDTGELSYDPFDRQGLQHIAVGDRVSVTGTFDDSDFFDNPEIDANSLIELSA
ncbi:MAG TPA: DUF5666 domain-containing protein [Qipengyuania sp.]|nr:DUF5666 domain-containing protein [Qipengyuania sp.]